MLVEYIEFFKISPWDDKLLHNAPHNGRVQGHVTHFIRCWPPQSYLWISLAGHFKCCVLI